MEEEGHVRKSVDTTSSSVKSKTPFMLPAAASFTFAIISSIFAGLSKRHVKSTTDTSGVGTRKAIPVNLPFSAGITLVKALAAPVEDGIILAAAARPPLQSFLEVPSTTI